MRKDISQLERKQVETLLELGIRLRERRESYYLSLEQVAARTMIQPRLLRAIETGNLHDLPEPVYVQGFIKHYADALELNGAEFARAFPLESTFHSFQPAWKDSPAAQLRPIHLYAAYVLLIVLAISGLSYLMNHSNGWTSSQIGNGQGLSILGGEDGDRPSSTTPTQSRLREVTNPPLPAKSVRVDVTLTSESWLRVEVDGKMDFQGTLPEGTQKTWMANAELKVRAGNAGGVMVAYNNGQPRLMGDLGAVKELIFSRSQQAAQLESAETASLR